MTTTKMLACLCLALLPQLAAHAATASTRLEAVDEKVVRDSTTGLRWTRKDSGYAVDWFAARDYCSRLGPGWRLPAADELERIGEAVRAATAGCSGAACGAASPLRLGDGWIWSDTFNGISDAIAVNLLRGERQVTYRAKRQRALCVGDA